MSDEVTAQGIVLKAMPYRESDCILTIYFAEYGKLSVLAGGVYKSKSKNAAACQPLTFGEYTLFLKSGLSRLKKATVIRRFQHLENDLNALACATMICEYFYRGVEENQPDREHFHWLKYVFIHLDNGYPYLLVYLFILAFILKDSGSELMVDHCVYCDNQREIVSVSLSAGGFVCLHHIKQEDPFYPTEVLRLIRYVNRLDITEIDRVVCDEKTILEGKRIMESFLDEYCPIRFSSRQFI